MLEAYKCPINQCKLGDAQGKQRTPRPQRAENMMMPINERFKSGKYERFKSGNMNNSKVENMNESKVENMNDSKVENMNDSKWEI